MAVPGIISLLVEPPTAVFQPGKSPTSRPGKPPEGGRGAAGAMAKGKVGFIADAHDDGLSAAFEGYAKKGGWAGVVGGEHKPSAAEWKMQLRGDPLKLFVLFGTGTIASTFAPDVLASTRVGEP